MNDDNLPPLPEPVAHLHSNGDFCIDRSIDASTWPVNLYTAAQVEQIRRVAILAERERCAKVCEEFEAEWSRLAKGNRDGTYDNMQDAAEQCAAAIREGGK